MNPKNIGLQSVQDQNSMIIQIISNFEDQLAKLIDKERQIQNSLKLKDMNEFLQFLSKTRNGLNQNCGLKQTFLGQKMPI